MAHASKPSAKIKERKHGLFKRLKNHIRDYTSKDFIKNVISNPDYIWILAVILILAEVLVNAWVIENIKYTEIDWKAYMQEVQGVINGTFDYSLLKGDTGPLVYPAGFVYIFLILYHLTNKGTNIYIAQYIFALFYLFTILLVFRIYYKTRKVPPYALLFLCCTSYRIHSIFVLRLFNDPVAMLLLFLSVNLFLDNKWLWGSVIYSLSVSVKMNILLFAPALFILMLISQGIWHTIILIGVCSVIQLVLGLPFLISNPWAYISGAFDLSRIFLYKWTVNWRFLPEHIFVDRQFHLLLLFLHLLVLLLFTKKYWLRMVSHYTDFFKGGTQLSPNSIFLPLCTANFIGLAFSRSLHYQFYVWYFHTLPYILWNTKLPIVFRICLLGIIELCWNTYPSTILSSALLHVCHLIILGALYWTQPQAKILSLKRDDRQKEHWN